MSWKKKKKKIITVKHKVKIVICLMFTVVLGLIVIGCYRFIFNKANTFKVVSRVDNLAKEKNIKNSTYRKIAWLKIQGTNIDLPVVYSENTNELFPVQLESFAWTDIKFDKDSTYYQVTGHNVFNLSANPKIKSDSFHRFEDLMAFVYYDFAKDNRYIQLTIDDKDYVFKIFCVGFVDKSTATFLPLTDKPVDYEKKQAIDIYNSINLYKYDIDVNTNDKIISLSTCTRFFGASDNIEFYVVARQLREDEKINNYKITKSDNYNKVEKILKGDENYE